MSNAGPQFPTHEEMHPHTVQGHVPKEEGGDPSGRFTSNYTAHHYDTSGGVVHSDPHPTIEAAHKWLTTSAVAGSSSAADSGRSGPGGHPSAYSIGRHVTDNHTGTKTSSSHEFDTGHLFVQPLAKGAKPAERIVSSQRVKGLDLTKWREQAMTSSRSQVAAEGRKRPSAAKGK